MPGVVKKELSYWVSLNVWTSIVTSERFKPGLAENWVSKRFANISALSSME